MGKNKEVRDKKQFKGAVYAMKHKNLNTCIKVSLY